MKKLLSVIICLCVVSAMVVMPNVSAEEIIVEFDGKQIEFDVNPMLIDGRTMVPLRKIFEEIGASVKWDGETQTVSARKNKKTITLAIGSNELSIDKGKKDEEDNPITETVEVDVAARIVDGRTLVPARVISESFGLDVDWDEDNRKVIISSNDEEDDSWKENVGFINLDDLTHEGDGVEIEGNQIRITAGGDFTISGTLAEGNITISAKEKVKIRLSGAEIISGNNPCIFVEEADKAYITFSDGTENMLVAENSEDGAIYSKEDLEIKGDGTLKIESKAGHGIKASDNLNIENGSITINATSDGIHINDTFKMTGGVINITAIGDGIDCESVVNISDGIINIETNGTPIENEPTLTEEVQMAPPRGMWEDEADVEFEKSTKGINAEWMMIISGGKINIDSASHAIHCADEIEIDGGEFTLSSKYDKGISAHGNLSINGEDTVIDITKSTEGIESKNVMTINGGAVSIVSSDDAINATGGNSGMMMPGGNFREKADRGEKILPEGFEGRENILPESTNMQRNQRMRQKRGEEGMLQNVEPPQFPENGENMQPPQFPENGNDITSGGFTGGMGRNMKECLVINGGYLELSSGDDCLDANGNMTINGGVIKATKSNGTFSGPEGIIDPDGQTTISEKATLIFASGNGNVRNLGLSQNTITVYCENVHEADENISISDSDGNVVFEYSPKGSFKTILIASPEIKAGEKYTIKISNENIETEMENKNVVIGAENANNMRIFENNREIQ